METYRCSRCGYKTKKEKQPENCNYCSREGYMKKIDDADSILKMID